MNNTARRLISLMLAILTLAFVFASCADSSPEETTAGGEAAGTTLPEETTEDIYDKDGFLKDRIPETLNYGGEVVDILYWNNAKNAEYDTEDDGDIINSSIFNRNNIVEDRIGIQFNWIGEKGDYSQRNDFNDIISADLSGSCIYDIISAYSTTIAMAATHGYATDLLEYQDALSFDMPWWGADLTEMATINDKLYFATGDISTNYLLRMYGTFFNKTLIDDNKLANPYDLVDDNKWTVDEFIKLASVFKGDSSTGGEVTYGLVHDAITLEALFYGSNLKFVEKDADDVPYLSESWKDVRAQSLMDKMAAYCKTSSVLNDSKEDENTFAKGSSLFVIYSLDLAMNYLGGGDLDYGIVPIPKYDADQENYSTTLNYKYSLYMISKGTDIPEIAAYTLEAMASQSYRTVTPDLYEVAMKIRYVTDVTSQRMIDHIRDGVSFEIGRTFTHVFDYDTYRTIRKALAGTADAGWQSTATSYAPVFEKNLKTLIDAFNS